MLAKKAFTVPIPDAIADLQNISKPAPEQDAMAKFYRELDLRYDEILLQSGIDKIMLPPPPKKTLKKQTPLVAEFQDWDPGFENLFYTAVPDQLAIQLLQNETRNIIEGWKFNQVIVSSLNQAFDVLSNSLSQLFKQQQELPLANLVPLLSNVANQKLMKEIVLALSSNNLVQDLVDDIVETP